MPKQLIKGNEAIVKAAVLAGCRAYYGYPITPASEIAEAAALYLPQAGGVFLQAESEVAAINMLYGAASAGVRAMTASSGPGISLMQEGLSYIAGSELPCVVADIMRAGPGLGNIAPEQGDYNQIVKGGGHGNYRTLVLAPDSVQEMADLTTLAFDLADEYRNPVVVLADGYIGQMMEPVEFASRAFVPPPAGVGREGHGGDAAQPDLFHLPGAGFDGAARPQAGGQVPAGRARSGARRMLAHGGRRDRPGGLRHRGPRFESRGGAWPAPAAWPWDCFVPLRCILSPSARIRELSRRAQAFAVVELSTGQMVDDVRLALEGRRPVEFYSRVGGNVPSAEEVLAFVERKFASREEVTIHG